MAKSKTKTVLVLTAFLLAVIVGWGAPQASAATIPTDISINWAVVQINSLLDRGIVSGYPDGTFRPDNVVSRAEFISMINKAFGFDTIADIDYTDVSANDWFFNDIAKAKMAGYIGGFPDGTMKPNDPITREEGATILAKALLLDTSSYDILPFSDASKIQTWSINSVSALMTAGLIGGYPDGSFKPANPVTRAEAAVLIVNTSATWVPVTGIILEMPTLTLKAGNSRILFAIVQPVEASDKAISWQTDDSSVATVDDGGSITAIAPGTCTITVTTHNGAKTADCVVTVIP